MLDEYAAQGDKDKIKGHTDLLQQAIFDVDIAVSLGMIPKDYIKNDAHMFAIINYVFQQENTTENANISKIGNQIINYISTYRSNNNSSFNLDKFIMEATQAGATINYY